MDNSLVEFQSKKAFFQSAMLDFWAYFGRKSLPWRLTKDPWKILIAEVLLRKTTTKQAEAVYTQLADLSPTKLAEMPEDVLQNILRPLGIHSVRARQLLTIAGAVILHGVASLETPAFLDDLPGIGRYIKNSILCVSFGIRKPGMDTNMIRVIQRVFSTPITRSRAREDPGLWAFAEELMPDHSCEKYNWAVLDFAAAVCKPRPLCNECPINTICNYYQGQKEKMGRSDSLPIEDDSTL